MTTPTIDGNMSPLRDDALLRILTNAQVGLGDCANVFVTATTASGPDASWVVERLCTEDEAPPCVIVTLDIPPPSHGVLMTAHRASGTAIFTDHLESVAFLAGEALATAHFMLWPRLPVNLDRETERRGREAVARWASQRE